MILTEARSAASSLSPGLKLLLAAVFLLPLLAYWDTAASIVAIWERSGTFAHGYVIVPISLWLIWQRRAALRGMTPTPYWPALAALAGCGAAWLLADVGQVQVVRQYAFALMLPLTALAMLGKRLAGAIAFPLCFLVLGVPFGDSFIEPMIGITANFTVDALRATGIPVLREGNNFSIPSGNWSVVEACSGVRYLIASFTLGTLYAYLTYRSLKRRLLFILASILVPIVANGLRAYMIVMMGHLSGMTMAVGFDHLIYGWLFFGLVMFLLFWIGVFWRQDVDLTGAAAVADAGAVAAAPADMTALAKAGLAVALCLALWPAYARYLDGTQSHRTPVELAGYRAAATMVPAFSPWQPAATPASAELTQFYRQQGQPVGLTLRYYREQADGGKLISSSNQLVQGGGLGWHVLASGTQRADAAGRTLQLREATIAGPQGKLLVWSWYWIGGRVTSSDYVGKTLQIRQKLLHGSDEGAAVMLFSPYEEQPEPARAALRAFLAANLVSLEATLARNLQP